MDFQIVRRARSFIPTSKRAAFALFLLGCMAFSSAWADPPGRVGRLGGLTGQVWLYSPDSGEWISAARNRPLTSGDRLATDANSRAEVRIGSTTVRLDAGTELEIAQIDDDHISLQLHNGSIATRLRSDDAAREFELRTDEGRFIVNRPGRFRFDRFDATSDVTVWSGEAVFQGPGSALTVYSGQRGEFWLDRNNAAQYSLTDPVSDTFAAWAGDLDRRDDRSASARYVSPEMTGVEDLDRYGRWQQTPDYGAIWVPTTVPAGWAPYGMGHWAWISPWGWTWVDDAPWGFAPFHYGRWTMFHNRWCWVPGTYVRRPVYAPALVGWVGGPRFNVSISVGSAPAVGWFPLAPREVYVPTYRVSPHYVQQVNITHVTNITNITTIVNNPQQAVTHVDYRNRHFPHAVTVVPETVMVNRQPVAPAAGQFHLPSIASKIANQPVQNNIAAPPVAGRPITPAIEQARRMHNHAEPATRGGPAAAQASTQPALVVPPPPGRVSGIPGSQGEGRGRIVVPPQPQATPATRRDHDQGLPPPRVAPPVVTPQEQQRRGFEQQQHEQQERQRLQDERLRQPAQRPAPQPSVQPAVPVIQTPPAPRPPEPPKGRDPREDGRSQRVASPQPPVRVTPSEPPRDAVAAPTTRADEGRGRPVPHQPPPQAVPPAAQTTTAPVVRPAPPNVPERKNDARPPGAQEHGRPGGAPDARNHDEQRNGPGERRRQE